MSARSSMTMRAAVQRKADGESNSWNRPGAPTFGEVGQIDCKVWSTMREDKDDAGKTIVVEDLRAYVPSSADVLEGDQLTNVRDRLGVVQFTGPLLVETIARAGGSGSRPSHRIAVLRRHGGA